MHPCHFARTAFACRAIYSPTMTEVFQAIVLGIVQGLTEFLPISSTAHLVLVPWLLGWESPLLNSLTFDMALHMGTLVAVLAYFARDWIQLIGGFFASLRDWNLQAPGAKLAWLVGIGTIPAIVIGLLLEKLAESTFRSPLQVALVLGAFSFVFLLAERWAKQVRAANSLTFLEATLIGLGQALAIIPGVSRSGATISAGLLLGLDRSAAARYSFLLSTPIIAGAGIKRLYELRAVSITESDAFLMLIGAVSAGIAGWMCIRWLIRFLGRRGLGAFVWYRLALAFVVIVVYFVRGGV